MKRDLIPATLSVGFARYGRYVARHPWPFLIVPPLITIALSMGLIMVDVTRDIEYLYTPRNAPSKKERAIVESKFEVDERNYFSPIRMTRDQGYVNVILLNKRAKNILTDPAMEEVYRVDRIIRELEVKHGSKKLRYSDVCAAWMGQCVTNSFLDFVANRSLSRVFFTHPLHYLPLRGGVLDFTNQVGGDVTKDNDDYVTSARALQLSYYARYEKSRDEKESEAWLNGIRDRLLKYNNPRLELDFQTALSIEQEFENSIQEVIFLFVAAFSLMSLFVIGSVLMIDWVRAKPFVALAGFFSAIFASATSMGLLIYCGVPFASPIGISPFLIIGIGLDDMYILVSAWRCTSVLLPVEERMALTLKDSAVSITITSVTDALAFGIGMTSIFRSVEIFCAYVMTGVLFCYAYQLTFTLAVMTLSGRREFNNRHALTFRHTTPRREAAAAGRSMFYLLCCTGGQSDYLTQSNSSTPNSLHKPVTNNRKFPGRPTSSVAGYDRNALNALDQVLYTDKSFSRIEPPLSRSSSKTRYIARKTQSMDRNGRNMDITANRDWNSLMVRRYPSVNAMVRSGGPSNQTMTSYHGNQGVYGNQGTLYGSVYPGAGSTLLRNGFHNAQQRYSNASLTRYGYYPQFDTNQITQLNQSFSHSPGVHSNRFSQPAVNSNTLLQPVVNSNGLTHPMQPVLNGNGLFVFTTNVSLRNENTRDPLYDTQHILRAHPGNCNANNNNNEQLNTSYDSSSFHENASITYTTITRIPTNEEELYSKNDTIQTIRQPSEKENIILPWLNKFLSSRFVDFLLTIPARIVILLLFLAYIGTAIYGITELKEGLKIEHLVPDDSYVNGYLATRDDHFRSAFGPIIQVIYTEKLDYTQLHVREDIEYVLNTFRRSKYFYDNEETTISWLEDFESYLTSTSRDINNLNNTQFIQILRNEFLRIPGYDTYIMDINFNRDFSAISSSRFFMRSRGIRLFQEQSEMMLKSREFVKQSDYDVISFHLAFVFFDVTPEILPNTLQSLGLAVACMFIVSLVFIPSLTTVILVTITTVSIELGVVGFMALWGVYLDTVSMINLIMCIGFSVDFAAHISYHYVISESWSEPRDTARDALGHLGAPILQAAMSSILAVVVLSASLSYVFRTFFKIVTLIMVFGFFHGLFLLPALLSTIQLARKWYRDSRVQTEEFLY